MWGLDQTSICPKCGELTHLFEKRHAGSFLEKTFPVNTCYCAACDHIVAEAYHSEEDRDIVIGYHDSDWRVKIPFPPRPHQAFDPERISFRTVLAHSLLEFRRKVRQQIGPIFRTDDPELDLCVPKPVGFDPEAVRSLFDKWLRNAKGGSAPKVTANDSTVLFHLSITMRMVFKIQLERLARRFPFPEQVTLHHFNEGRRYESQIKP